MTSAKAVRAGLGFALGMTLALGGAAVMTAAAPQQALAKAEATDITYIGNKAKGKLTVNVSTGSSGNTKYQVRWSRNKSMKGASYKNSTSSRDITIKGLKSGVKYYVQARAYKGGWGAWSAVTPRVTRYFGKLSGYSWAKIKSIANYIGKASSKKAALQRARKYGLVGPSLALSGYEKKSVRLANGKTYKVRILDFWHDSKTSGGKAGITFAFTTRIGFHKMNPTDTNKGGWAASSMRSWLNSTVNNSLPASLRKCIVPVRKHTNNKGETTSASGVTATSDKLWLPSVAELLGGFGVSTKYWDWGNSSYDAIYAAEGSKYKVFADNGVVTRRYVSGNSDPLQGECTKAHWEYRVNSSILYCLYNTQLGNISSGCWLRSPRPFYGGDAFAGVDSRGGVYGWFAAGDSGAVAPGFCL
ncbi:MAG: DUF6273 domain-containing protein [Coriobacteriia bacterium]|nr:DUF6273 domain-containing protein [Coriobacteriia bacterium]